MQNSYYPSVYLAGLPEESRKLVRAEIARSTPEYCVVLNTDYDNRVPAVKYLIENDLFHLLRHSENPQSFNGKFVRLTYYTKYGQVYYCPDIRKVYMRRRRLFYSVKPIEFRAKLRNYCYNFAYLPTLIPVSQLPRSIQNIIYDNKLAPPVCVKAIKYDIYPNIMVDLITKDLNQYLEYYDIQDVKDIKRKFSYEKFTIEFDSLSYCHIRYPDGKLQYVRLKKLSHLVIDEYFVPDLLVDPGMIEPQHLEWMSEHFDEQSYPALRMLESGEYPRMTPELYSLFRDVKCIDRESS